MVDWPISLDRAKAYDKRNCTGIGTGSPKGGSTQPLNSPVFVIKKKSVKWRMSRDLKASQLGISWPTLLPKEWSMIEIDLKDCFFTIPPQEQADTDMPSQWPLCQPKGTTGESCHKKC